MGRPIPQLLYVDFRRIDSGEKIGDKVLAGFYDISGEHHGRPVYRKRPSDPRNSQNSLGSDGKAAGGREVILHYWDGDGKPHADEDVGWWFGSHIGAHEVWAFHDKDSPEPPPKGWIFCDFFGCSADELELVIEPRSAQRNNCEPAAEPQPRAREQASAPGAEQPASACRGCARSCSGERRRSGGSGRPGARSQTPPARRRNRGSPERRRSGERVRTGDPYMDGGAGRGLQAWSGYGEGSRRLETPRLQAVKAERSRSRSRRRSPPRRAARSSSPGLRVRTASPSPREEDRARRAAARPARGQRDRASLLCANPGCWLLVHPEPVYGGFCCRKCHWCFSTGSKSKNKHGKQCKGVEGPDEHAPRAEPIAPKNPMALG